MLVTRRALLQAPLLLAARPPEVTVLNPRERVPLAWIFDDSTCLVNLNRFSIPQFAATYPERYKQEWRSMPYEIPDSFVRKFADWATETGVKGKWSVVPYPACVGRLDREVPGWTPKEVADSIAAVRKHVAPNFDIHPEMITHTRIIDLKTGHPTTQRTPDWMENWDWCAGRSVDEIASYIGYALQILKDVDLHCDGFTTPGGFGKGALDKLPKAGAQAVRSVFGTEMPHYFRNLFDKGSESVAPRIEDGIVSIYACTGDWTGNWDCSTQPEPDRFITADLSKGRLVDVIERGEPACMLSHWTGIYYNGRELGFQAMQEVVRRIHSRYKNVQWMKLADIARYWAAKELTEIQATPQGLRFKAPLACPDFTFRWKISQPPAMDPRSFRKDGDSFVITMNLPKGVTDLCARSCA